MVFTYLMIVLNWLLCSLIAFGQSRASSSWNITASFNPGCTSYCDSFNLLHVRAQNSTSSVHILLSASNAIPPSLIILRSLNPDAQPNVDWSKMKSYHKPLDTAVILDDVDQSYGLIFGELIEYDDVNDSATVPRHPGDRIKLHPLSEWSWNLTTPIDDTVHPIVGTELFKVSYVANSSISVFEKGGYVKIEFMVTSEDQHNPYMPRLKFVPGLTIQFEVSLVDLYTEYQSGRFGLSLGLVSNESVTLGGNYRRTSVYSINDEVTPGIFETISIRLDQRDDQDTSVAQIPGFLQTKPLCYVSENVRDIKASRDAKVADSLGPPKQNQLINRTLPYWLYGERSQQSIGSVGFRVWTVSLGTPEDSFYLNWKYVAWTATFGLGEPPLDYLSSLMIGVISLSAVVILVAFLFGTLLLLYFRWCRSSNRFSRLLEDNEDATANFPVST